jgi:mannose-6-phosphate isomerase-like protein (cupin superfamily)
MLPVSGVLHGPGEGERLAAGPSSEIVIKATGADTAGSFFLAESVIAPGFAGPPLHRHEAMHDMFYVLEGTLTLRVGDDEREAGPGTFACVPPGVAHTFSNPGTAPVRILNFSTPSGWEDYMRELAEAASSGPLTPEAFGRLASRHDLQVVRPDH